MCFSLWDRRHDDLFRSPAEMFGPTPESRPGFALAPWWVPLPCGRCWQQLRWWAARADVESEAGRRLAGALRCAGSLHWCWGVPRVHGAGWGWWCSLAMCAPGWRLLEAASGSRLCCPWGWTRCRSEGSGGGGSGCLVGKSWCEWRTGCRF